tara:strand:- start:259 stop:399 length:141 start_codon:yes stop_codon:yes gene_type:complete
MIEIIEDYLCNMADGHNPNDETDDYSMREAAIAYHAWLKLRESLGI